MAVRGLVNGEYTADEFADHYCIPRTPSPTKEQEKDE